jgi:poly-beta-hydroxyalkanoate depolymerase
VVEGETIAISEEVVWERPFCRLLHFKRAGRRRWSRSAGC